MYFENIMQFKNTAALIQKNVVALIFQKSSLEALLDGRRGNQWYT